MGELAPRPSEYGFGCGYGCGAAGWEQRAGYQHQVVRLSGVCAEGSRINRRLPVLGDTGARWLPAPGVSLPCSQAACCVVSLPPGSGISFQAPCRCRGLGRARRTIREALPGAALPNTARLMDPAAPGSGVSSLPLFLALALGKCPFWELQIRRKDRVLESCEP